MTRLTTISCILLLFTGIVQAQTDSIERIPYNKDFVFQDGIYLNFTEFKNNDPGIRHYELINDDAYGEPGRVILRYSCIDTSGAARNCIVKDCFGYCNKNVIHISQGFYGYYYRVFILGALTHYVAFSGMNQAPQMFATQPVAYVGTSNDYREYILDFETGDTFIFNYKNFSAFLKTHDVGLYERLKNSKKKRKMIYFYMLEYNKTHSISFPE